MKTNAMVILSGGQDSTTCLFWAKQNFDEVHAVTFNYGQRHNKELEAAKTVAELADVRSWQLIDVPQVLKSRSPLLNESQPLEKYDTYEEMNCIIGDRVELTFVPMRNAFFLTLATNLALAKDCSNIVIGVCQGDNDNYPDCRQSFVSLQEQTINEALGIDNFRIHTPLMNLSKAESVNLAQKIPGAMEALAYSHTCYAGEYPPCGKCHSCVLRQHGFDEAGISDPLLERAKL